MSVSKEYGYLINWVSTGIKRFKIENHEAVFNMLVSLHQYEAYDRTTHTVKGITIKGKKYLIKLDKGTVICTKQ